MPVEVLTAVTKPMEEKVLLSRLDSTSKPLLLISFAVDHVSNARLFFISPLKLKSVTGNTLS